MEDNARVNNNDGLEINGGLDKKKHNNLENENNTRFFL